MDNLMEKIVSLCKRRGFIFQSSEIYGGFASCYDYGPLGVELKNNIKVAWWNEMIRNQNPPAGGIVGLDAAILMSPKVWQASGHLSAGFADELVECKSCKKRFRLDQVGKECPECKGELTQPRKFNLMMKTFAGPIEDEAAQTYLRAETCQGIYMNYENVLQSMRLKIPFGIAQIGKSFRNEINPKDFTYRTREFEQMEMQWFCHPKEADKWFDFWKKERMDWYLSLGIKKENIRFREHEKNELAHYAKRAFDIEYKFPFASPTGRQGWKEIEGIHNRGDWDLSNHSKYSGKDLGYINAETKEKYMPYIIETSGGVDRSLLAFLIDAYEEIKGGRTETTQSVKEEEIVLRLNRKIAPIFVAVLPLVKNKEPIIKKAKEVYKLLRGDFVCQYDETGSIGKRYRRQDEIGTPFCITIDFDTLEKNDVTLRDRDT
ncbi:MAG: glycine--tRNA ligase, partial [Patescibacteria group bacterium]